MSQSESVLEWFTESDWQSKMRAVQNDKPSKFTIYNGSQSESVRKVKFDAFAWSFCSRHTESEREIFSESGQIIAHKNTLVFFHMTNKKQTA